ncbi:MAG TPA: hypothetical protein VMV19_04970 [Xanthobacteraceae bacterium]|nr:hypothetical protein [Xanthobacteraceae bacterium]
MSQWSAHGMNKEERHAYVLKRARDLAMTGDYMDSISIELALRHVEGFSEARGWLDNSLDREELDRLCTAARQKSPNTRGSIGDRRRT